MAAAARLDVHFELSSNVYRRSAPDIEKPQLIVTTILHGAPTLVLETRGEYDSGTVLVERFRAQHFEFYDLTASQPVVHDLFPGTCEPRDSLEPREVVEIAAAVPLVTHRQLEDMSPLSDPVRMLEAGHEYRIRLKPQRIPGYAMTKEGLFRGREDVPVNELPEAVLIEVASQDEVVLKIES